MKCCAASLAFVVCSATLLAQSPPLELDNDLVEHAKDLIQQKRFDQAQTSLNEYLKAHPNSANGEYLLAYVLFRLDKPADSLRTYTAAAALQRPTPAEFKIVGLDYVLLNDYPDALRWLERSVAEDPNDAEAVYYLGRAYYVQNNFDKAIAAFEQALQLDPQYVKAENNLGLSFAAKNQTALAEAAYRKAIEMGEELNQKSDQPYLNLAELMSHTSEQIDALSLLDQAEEIAGKSDHAEQLRGQILFAMNRLPEAEAAFHVAISLKPDDGTLRYLLGRVLKREGKSQDAAEQFAASKALNVLYGPDATLNAINSPQETSILRKMAKDAALAAMKVGDKAKAAKILEKARASLPHDPELLYESGFLAFESGSYQESDGFLCQALELRPAYPEATYLLGRAYLAENLAGPAESQMRKYLSQNPDDATAWYGLGYILMAEERLDEAKSAFQKSLAIQPEQTESIFELGEIALQQGQNEVALRNFNDVLNHDPHHGGALTEIGALDFRAGKYDDAKASLQRAIESAPAYQKAHYYYALTLSRLGQKTDADREFALATNLQKQHGGEHHLLKAQP